MAIIDAPVLEQRKTFCAEIVSMSFLERELTYISPPAAEVCVAIGSCKRSPRIPHTGHEHKQSGTVELHSLASKETD